MEDQIKITKYEEEKLQRGLKNRHIQMIAFGGAIGTGLFYGSASAIKMAGPAVIVAYCVVGLAIFFMMRALGEMAVEEPVSGSYVSYANRYIGRFAGFFIGWNGVFAMAATSVADFNALGHYVQYWFPNVPIWVSSLIVVVLITIINLLAVKVFGEMEFWFSIVKVTAILAMIAIGASIILFGIGNGGQAIGFGNLVHHGGFMPNGLYGVFLSLVLVAFAFGGVEYVGVTAGEAGDVKHTIPKAINSVFWRIMIFYVGAIIVMITLYPWNNIGTQGSPFVLVFSKIGIPAAADILNFVVITAAFSGLNSGIYAYSRALYNLSLQGNAPAILGKVSRKKSPYMAISAIVVVQLLGVLANYFIPGKAFTYFSTIVVFGLVANWIAILVSHLKFRKVRIQNNTYNEVAFKMPFSPYSDYFALAFMIMIIIIMGIIPDTRITLYVAPVWVIVLYLYYRLYVMRRQTLTAPKDKLDA